ncbi:MAG: hypothetical protein HY841_02975 [Bacteroidetes bacterium]|nr:hypothetical protein [Bacteroidota bacterium]
MNKFNKNVLKHLGHYVYALIDPFDKKIFYVGKASSNNRAYDHLKATNSESKKIKKIKEIRSRNKQPIVEIIRYGLASEKIALEVEASIIDTVGIENLTNSVRGHGIEKGRLSVNEIERLYGSKPICVKDIKEKYMYFSINETFSPTKNETQLYDCTRQFWSNVSKDTRTQKAGKLEYPTALAIYDSVVINVYKIEAWFPAGATMSSRTNENTKRRWEFVGNLIPNHILQGKKLVDNNENNLRLNQQGYGYIN